MTITENTSSLTTPRERPIVAKIRPTSPRGTIANPTTSLFAPLPAANPAAIFPIKATKVIARATSSIWGLKSVSRFTLIPVYKKKIGTKKSPIGSIISSMWRCAW